MRKLNINPLMGKLPFDKFKVWYGKKKWEKEFKITPEQAYKSCGGKK